MSAQPSLFESDAKIIVRKPSATDNDSVKAVKPQRKSSRGFNREEIIGLIDKIRSGDVDPARAFWRKVDKTPGFGPNGDCWKWLGCQHDKGYGGRIGVGNGKIYPHQLSYVMAHGPVPEGHEINHKCENKLCVNPDHLEALTHKRNLHYSDTIASRNVAKTHCPMGHEYTPGNTFPAPIKGGGFGRGCKACRVIKANISKKARMARDPEYDARIKAEDAARSRARRARLKAERYARRYA